MKGGFAARKIIDHQADLYFVVSDVGFVQWHAMTMHIGKELPIFDD
jgi:hypothetical protein